MRIQNSRIAHHFQKLYNESFDWHFANRDHLAGKTFDTCKLNDVIEFAPPMPLHPELAPAHCI